MCITQPHRKDTEQQDERSGDQETVSTRAFEIPLSTGVSRAIIVAFDETTYSPSEQRRHDVTIYWEFRGKRFATHLFYVIGDPRAKHYEDVLTKFMRSIQPR